MIEQGGFTGTQDGMTMKQILALEPMLAGLTWLHHGDCIGADAQAHVLALRHGVKVHLHPPKSPNKRAWCENWSIKDFELDYLERNHVIVNDSSIMFACPAQRQEQLRSGTWATIRYAKKVGKSLLIIYPDGTIDHYIGNNLIC